MDAQRITDWLSLIVRSATRGEEYLNNKDNKGIEGSLRDMELAIGAIRREITVLKDKASCRPEPVQWVQDGYKCQWCKPKELKMSSEMIERVAKIIYIEMVFGDTSVEFEKQDENLKQHYYGVAKAAIAAMREPTDKMLDSVSNGEYVWQTMIDEALKE